MEKINVIIKKYNLKFTCGMKGYSLIELILGMAISIVLITTMISILNITQKSLNLTYNQTSSDIKILSAMEYMKDEIRGSHYYINNNGLYIFVVDEGNRYKYINYVEKNKNIVRRVSKQRTLFDNKKIYFDGSNILFENCDHFSLVVDNDVININIKIRDKSYDCSIAMRLKKYEKK